jgi:hypothetical protein
VQGGSFALGSPYSLGHLSDTELLTGTRGLVARSNHLLAAFLAHLAEVEVRGIHRFRACSSLYTYCLYELRLSEDSAYRHARAAKIARRFPILFAKIAAGEIHLSGVLLLGPHLTEENHHEVLERAKHRSKREIAKLVRVLDPLPDVPPRIEPLGPPSALSPTSGTWQTFMESLSPVRELDPGHRPKDWIDLPVNERDLSSTLSTPDDSTGPAELRQAHAAIETECHDGSALDLVPQRFRIQFTASQDYVHLLQRATDLLSHKDPTRSLAEVHLRAMRLLVRELEKRKYAASETAPAIHTESSEAKSITRPHDILTEKASKTEASPELDDTKPGANPLPCERTVHKPDNRVSRDPCHAQRSYPAVKSGTPAVSPLNHSRDAQHPRHAGKADTRAVSAQRDSCDRRSPSEDPRRRGRYVAAQVRRKVHERDGNRCSYVDSSGRRCRETSFLELHHLHPYAKGGRSTFDNLALRCRSHNALAAEADFGRTHMTRKTGAE